MLALRWYEVAVPPTLHGSMISMSQLAGHRADAAKLTDYVPNVHDTLYARSVLDVNLENVPGSDEKARMAQRTIGQRLLALKARTELTLDEIGQRAGYRGKSSVQKYFHPQYDMPQLSSSVAKKLEKALVGQGQPKIGRAEIWDMVGGPVPVDVSDDALTAMELTVANLLVRDGKSQEEAVQFAQLAREAAQLALVPEGDIDIATRSHHAARAVWHLRRDPTLN